MDLIAQFAAINTISLDALTGLFIALLALIVSLLTLYNAARLRTGVLALSTAAFGAGMFALAVGFFLLSIPQWALDPARAQPLYRLLFVVGFTLLGIGSYKIYRMSRI